MPISFPMLSLKLRSQWDSGDPRPLGGAAVLTCRRPTAPLGQCAAATVPLEEEEAAVKCKLQIFPVGSLISSWNGSLGGHVPRCVPGVPQSGMSCTDAGAVFCFLVNNFTTNLYLELPSWGTWGQAQLCPLLLLGLAGVNTGQEVSRQL